MLIMRDAYHGAEILCRWNAVHSEITGLLCPSHGWIWRPRSARRVDLTPLATSRNFMNVRFCPMFIRHRDQRRVLTAVTSSHISGFEPEEFGGTEHPWHKSLPPVEQNDTKTKSAVWPCNRVERTLNSQDCEICCHCRPKKKNRMITRKALTTNS